jgi:hypothetical protein
MAIDIANLRAVKSNAKKDLGDKPGVIGFGIGDGTLRIYVRDSETARTLPSLYEGIQVEPVVEGDVVAYHG